ncbi:OmpH family outer membrane protein [Leeia sp. TBRC 13508]|uniref:OmpH family outer membrane protein n=1 Tax=Leeia speluncae TaxID=2884804 RepID=A0ABS8D5W1_9NEIS|nr:OmpH family outer membrane protein [Leeia speluncae]MCB6183601.1 OmpH family outer membrane protein [Leeia speluncae]
MSKFAKFLGVVAAGLLSLQVTAAELKIGVVNTDRLFQQSSPAQKINKKLQDEFSKKDASLQQLRQQLKDLQADLEKNDATLSDADKTKKQGQIRDLNTRYQRAEREFREDLNTRQGEEMAKLQEVAIRAVRQLAETEKFDLILQGQDLAYVSPRVDVTDKILKLMGDK